MTRSGVIARVATVLGVVAGRAFWVAARLRDTKPIHPAGRVGPGVLKVTSPRPDLGIALLSAPGSHPCLARWSRSAGVPSPLPDVEGLAIRLEDDGPGPGADVLFASTGTGRIRRFVLAPRAPHHHGPQTTILPVRTAAGPLLMKVQPLAGEGEPPVEWDLAVASFQSEWSTVGRLTVSWGPDRPLRFDPIKNCLSGTDQYDWVRRLRAPAYLMARQATRARPDTEPSLR